jgi:hypothetical protein
MIFEAGEYWIFQPTDVYESDLKEVVKITSIGGDKVSFFYIYNVNGEKIAEALKYKITRTTNYFWINYRYLGEEEFKKLLDEKDIRDIIE